MKLFSYVVARDFGFAPNPFYGFCTLATCKPKIRSSAKIGDWILGTGSKRNKKNNHIVYIMNVTEVMSFDDYWKDPRFTNKKPNLYGSKKQAFGDNIYRRSKSGSWHQIDSHHSFGDGSSNPGNISNDTQTNRILISENFIYWGGTGPKIPKCFTNYKGYDIRARRGHKNKFPDKLVEDFTSWIETLDSNGYCGEPLDWRRSA